jgi:hypothetical protein
MILVLLDSMLKHSANEKTNNGHIKKGRFEKVLVDVHAIVPEGCASPTMLQLLKKWQALKGRFQKVFNNNMKTTGASPMGFTYYNECFHLIGQNDATQPPYQISGRRITIREGDNVNVQEGPAASEEGGTQGQGGDPAATQAQRPRNLRPPDLRAPMRTSTQADKGKRPAEEEPDDILDPDIEYIQEEEERGATPQPSLSRPAKSNRNTRGSGQVAHRERGSIARAAKTARGMTKAMAKEGSRNRKNTMNMMMMVAHSQATMMHMMLTADGKQCPKPVEPTLVVISDDDDSNTKFSCLRKKC